MTLSCLLEFLRHKTTRELEETYIKLGVMRGIFLQTILDRKYGRERCSVNC